MEKILKTTLLEFEKNIFLIDLVIYDSNSHYVKITQKIIEEGTSVTRVIKINHSLLNEIINTLQLYQYVIPQTHKDPKALQNREIIKRYLKGVSIKDLSIQFDCPYKLIEKMLYEEGIEVVENDITKVHRKPKKRRRSY